MVTDWYLPGFKAGGPLRTISNLIAVLGGEDLDFRVLTRDRDLTDKGPYKDVKTERWTPVGNARVFYTRKPSFAILVRTIRKSSPDVIYMNSFFSRFTFKILLLRRLGLIAPAATVLAPRGEFSPGALEIKRTKKRGFLVLTNALGLYRDILWHASADRERLEIEQAFSKLPFGIGSWHRGSSQIQVASEFPDHMPALAPGLRKLRKAAGAASFTFVSRVSPKKNLIAAIEMLSSLRGEVTFEVYGPVDDHAYFAKCEQAALSAPPNVRIWFKGTLAHEEVSATFRKHHFFLFPTFGENFGHVIVESLANGCPVLISDQTPWSDLGDEGVGWDLPLGEHARWTKVLQECVDMPDDTYQAMSRAAVNFMQGCLDPQRIKEENLALFKCGRGLGAHRDDPEQGTDRDSPHQSSKALSC